LTQPLVSVDIESTNFKLVKSVNIYLVGDPKNTASKVKGWLDQFKSIIAESNLQQLTSFSSWAIVVDIVWKGELKPVRKQGITPS